MVTNQGHILSYQFSLSSINYSTKVFAVQPLYDHKHNKPMGHEPVALWIHNLIV